MKKVFLIILTIFVMFIFASCGETCDHEWSEWTTVKNPTCTENGQNERYCSLCERIDKKSINKLEHSFGAAYAKNEEGHYHFCEICGYEENLEAHTAGAANELGNVRCSTCQYLLSENKNTFYDNLLKSNKNFILELKNLDITDEWTSIINQQINMFSDKYTINGYAIFMDTDNGMNILVQGDLLYEYNYSEEVEYSEASLNAVFDGENFYIEVAYSEEGTSDYHTIKVSYEYVFDYFLNETNIQPAMISFASEAAPNVIKKLFNLTDNELLKIMIDLAFTKEKTTNGYKLTFDLNNATELILSITSKPVNSIFDKVFGKGEYTITKSNLIKILYAKLSNLVKMMQVKYDIDVKQVLIDFAKINNFDSSEIELIFNDAELMNKSCIDLLCEDSDMTRSEVLEEIDDIFERLETNIIILDKQMSKELVETISLIKEAVDLVVYTDSEGFITNVEMGFKQEDFDGYDVDGEASIYEYFDEEKFNIEKERIINSYNESIPTIDLDKAHDNQGSIIKVTETSVTLQLKEKYYKTIYDYSTQTYQYLYYYEYKLVTFDFEDIEGVSITSYFETHDGPSMDNIIIPDDFSPDGELSDNNEYTEYYINVVGSCSGQVIVDGQLYYDDGTQAYYDSSLNVEYDFKNTMVNSQ